MIAEKDLRRLVEEGLTQREIAERLGVSLSTVKNWLGKYQLKTQASYYIGLEQRKKNERQKALDRKLMLVKEKGGRCQGCGYQKNLGALTFHHLDPSNKLFELAVRQMYYSLDKIRCEAEKCKILCQNCQAELHWPHLNGLL